MKYLVLLTLLSVLSVASANVTTMNAGIDIKDCPRGKKVYNNFQSEDFNPRSQNALFNPSQGLVFTVNGNMDHCRSDPDTSPPQLTKLGNKMAIFSPKGSVHIVAHAADSVIDIESFIFACKPVYPRSTCSIRITGLEAGTEHFISSREVYKESFADKEHNIPNLKKTEFLVPREWNSMRELVITVDQQNCESCEPGQPGHGPLYLSDLNYTVRPRCMPQEMRKKAEY